MKLYEYLKYNAEHYPTKVGAICNNEEITYLELYDKALLKSSEYKQRIQKCRKAIKRCPYKRAAMTFSLLYYLSLVHSSSFPKVSDNT